MDFRIADTFADALARLPAQDQKAAKISALDLQLNPVSTGLQFHRIDKSKDRNFWSVRANRDIRIIVHKTENSILLAYVDHHDKAYQWAERRRIEAHPKTGAIQIVEVRERLEQARPASSLESSSDEAPNISEVVTLPFNRLTEDQLLSVGVPPDWLADILNANEDRFLNLADHLPSEAAEALLEYVTTGSLATRPLPVSSQDSVSESRAPSNAVKSTSDEFAAIRAAEAIGYSHPDALRRFRTIENAEELRVALEYPWDKWLLFLHPSQRDIIAKDFSGPARVAGSAGTGKTVVALHRAARLARSAPDTRVLLTTFSKPLATMLRRKLEMLTENDGSLLARLTVSPFHGVAEELFELSFGRRPHIASEDLIRSMLAKAVDELSAQDAPIRFLVSEWSNVIDAWQLADEEAYATVPRLGRKNRLSAKQRSRLWPIFQKVREGLAQKGTRTWAGVCSELSARYANSPTKPFSHVVVDEAQDLGVPELRLLAAIAPNVPNNLFFAGDLGQRIFQQPFSWLGLGVDVRGRSQVLNVNYRTSHQIRLAADKLLPNVVRDVDGLEERRDATVSAFNGPEPRIAQFPTSNTEIAAVSDWIKQARQDGFASSEIGIFVRSHEQIDRARAAVKAAGEADLVLSDRIEDVGNRISVGTMHLAKGLEFKAVSVMACDDEVLPLQARVESVADEVELDDVYETERQLLYVACTRARDRLFVTCVGPGSEFLSDLSAD